MSISNLLVKMDQKSKVNDSEYFEAKENAIRGIKAVSELMCEAGLSKESQLPNEALYDVGNLIRDLIAITEYCQEQKSSERHNLRKIS